jgi:hypothetical protein
MIFHKPNDNVFNLNNTVYVGNESIERVLSFKYLGVILDPSLSFSSHFNHVNNKLNSVIGRLHNFKRLVSEKIMKLLVNSYFDSVIEFCLPIWSVQPPETLNLLFEKLLRFYININYPSLMKKCKRLGIKNRHSVKRLNVSEIIKRYNLFSVSEKRDLQLLKLVLESKHHPFMDDWFTLSERDSRHWPTMMAPLIDGQIPSSQSFNRSIRFRGYKFWNSLTLEKSLLTEASRAEIMCAAQELIIKRRSDIFVTI